MRGEIHKVLVLLTAHVISWAGQPSTLEWTWEEIDLLFFTVEQNI